MRCHDAKVEPDDCAVFLCLGEEGTEFKTKATISMTPHETEQLAKELLYAAEEVKVRQRMALED